jgi:hypothetical protein
MNLRYSTILVVAILLGFSASIIQAADELTQRKARTKGPRPEEDISKVSSQRSPDKVVVFKKTPQGELKAHIYFPPGWSETDRRPAIVFWSGGAFRSGAVGAVFVQGRILRLPRSRRDLRRISGKTLA